jgi:hypothetical protein
VRRVTKLVDELKQINAQQLEPYLYCLIKNARLLVLGWSLYNSGISERAYTFWESYKKGGVYTEWARESGGET